jgi:hypothetical protein
MFGLLQQEKHNLDLGQGEILLAEDLAVILKRGRRRLEARPLNFPADDLGLTLE